MAVLQVKTEAKAYDVYIEESFAGLKGALAHAGLLGRQVLCVSDRTVADIYLKEIGAAIGPASRFHSFIFEPGEQAKDLAQVKSIYRVLMDNQFRRNSVIMALGGGVAGDLAGFAASTYMRGIPYVQIPTSLLAQVDSSVGGKVGVNFGGAKNMVGAFYQPELVYMHTGTLKTLDRTQFISGMAEVIKYGFICDKEFLAYLGHSRISILAHQDSALSYMIEKSVSMKAGIVGRDERESGLREILNFGHTFGHAVECLSGLPHGICVGLGMVCALYVSCQYGRITVEEYGAALDLLKSYGLPGSIREAGAGCIEVHKLYEAALLDKKIRDHKLYVILLEEVGKAGWPVNLSKAEAIDAFRQISQ